jgi:hypothetical protein
MLFRRDPTGLIAISQPAHAWISGRLLRAWDGELPEPLLLAAEQHDVAWLDWEVDPSFDASAGRPHLFRDIGASLHAPMWTRGVDRALAAWGPHVALLVSRHGGVIYRRFMTRHRIDEADAAAAKRYLETQAPREAAWAKALGLDETELERQSGLIAFVDALSLVICGELKAPIEIEAPDGKGGIRSLKVTERAGRPFEFVVSPWPFRGEDIAIEGDGRRLPDEGRFADEPSFRRWMASAERTPFRSRLAPA